MQLRRQLVSHDFLQMKIQSYFRQPTDTNEEATSISLRKPRDQGCANLHYFFSVFKKLMRVKFPLWTHNQADVPSINHLSEWIEGLWIVCVYRGGEGAIPTSEKWWFIHINKLVEREAFIDFVRVESVELRDFCSMFLRFSEFSWWRERPQIVTLWVEWFRSLIWRTTGLAASLSYFLRSR